MDLSLPSKWPAEAHFLLTTALPTALYTLVDLTQDELLQVQQACEAACIEDGDEPNSRIRIAPQSRFIGQPLRAVFGHHVERQTRDAAVELDPNQFIVVVHEDWRRKGVLAVFTLDNEELEEGEGGIVDTFFLDAENVGHSMGNIKLGNLDWFELKQLYEIQPGREDAGNSDEDDAVRP